MLKIEDLKVGDLIKYIGDDDYLKIDCLIPQTTQMIISDGEYTKFHLPYDELVNFEKLPYNHKMILEPHEYNFINNKVVIEIMATQTQLRLDDIIKFIHIDTGEYVLKRVIGLRKKDNFIVIHTEAVV